MTNRTDRIQTRVSSGRGPLLTILRLVAALSAVSLVWSTIRLEPWSPSPAPTDASESAIPWTEVNPIGVNTFLSREVEPWKRERTLEMASDAGIGWIKQHFSWRDLETAPDSYWDTSFQQDAWAKYDAIVESAERNGLRVIARIDLAPQWARPTGSSHTAPPANYADFADFVADFVEHYKGRIQFLQIWNEPNLAAEWGGNIDPDGYAELLRVAAEAARQVDPNIVILSAPMAMTTENSDRAMDDLTYWQALYGAGASPYFDIMSANAYGLDQPYDVPPSVDQLNIRRIELLRDLAVSNGDERKPIWLNEYGWNASPASFSPETLTWSRVTEAHQAEWSRKGIEYLRDTHDWFGVANTWYFRQVGDISSERSDYYFRAVDVEFTPRPLYRALQELGNELRYATPGVHNDLSASIRPLGSWSIIRDDEAIQGQYISGSTSDRLQLFVEGNSVRAVFASDQRATAITVTESGGKSREIIIAEGDTDVLLSSWSADQAIQKRQITVEVTGSKPLLLDGLIVAEHRSARTLAISAAALIVALGAWAVLRRDGPS